MNQNLFSIKSKISSISKFLLLVVLVLAEGCASAPTRIPPLQTGEGTVRESALPKPREIPPWQLWSDDPYGIPDLILAEDLARVGRFSEAVDAYGNSLRAADPELKSEILIRRCGTMLKLGRSRDALNDVSAAFESEKWTPENAEPRLAFIVAFAYEHLGDIDQALSWLSVAYRNDAKRSPITEQVISQVRRIIQGLTVEGFRVAEDKWHGDGFIGPYLTSERSRRAQGGLPQYVSVTKWFSPVTYGSNTSSALPQEIISEQPLINDGVGQGLVLGAILPLSGKFADHGKKVREGIELAVDDATKQGVAVRVVVGDTGGDPEQAVREYSRIAHEHRAQFFLGPLLVNTTKSVAARASSEGVPFLSFSKREGLKKGSGSDLFFRLGVTAENQAFELVNYAHQVLGYKRFAVVYPNSASGKELAASFRKNVQGSAATIVNELSYDSLTPDTVTSMIQVLEQGAPEAVFIADSLENVGPVLLDRLRAGALAKALLLGPATWDDRAAIRGFEKTLGEACFVTPYYAEGSQPELLNFIHRFKSKYGEEPGLLAAQAYDATKLVIQSAIIGDKMPLEIAPDHLKKQVRGVKNFNGVTGLLSTAPSGDINRRMTVLRLHEGELVEVMSYGLRKSFIGDAQKDQIGQSQ